MAMMRGVNCALASCTTRRREEHMNTMNVNIAPAMVPKTLRIASTL